MVKILNDCVSARVDSYCCSCGIGEFSRICKCRCIAHYNVDYFLKKKIVSEVVSLYNVSEIDCSVKVFKICFLRIR